MKQYITISFFLLSTLFSNSKIGYIINVEGHVKIISNESNVLELDAVEGRYIYENDILRSYNRNSLCTVIFLDRTALFSISNNTEIAINNLTEEVKKIQLNYGEVYIENASNFQSLLLFTPSSQIHCLSNSAFIQSSFKRDDIVHTFAKSVQIYNKKSALKTIVAPNSKAISSSSGEIVVNKQDEDFLPEQIIKSVKLDQSNLKVPLGEFKYKKGDLILDNSGDYILDVYKTPETKKIKINIASYASSINNNLYTKLVFNPQYKNNHFSIDLKIDQYFENNDSPKLNVWDEPIKILAKIERINYSKNLRRFEFKGGNLENITMGYGLLVKKYKNYFNYPLHNSHGAYFQYNSKDFVNIDFFSSNIEELLNGNGFWGFHTSIFVSKYMPLRLGFGIAADMNQFAGLPNSFSMMPSRDIESLEFDLSYDFYSKNSYTFKLISEIGAINFSEKHSYIRYDDDGNLNNALKNKRGAWGLSAGIQALYKEFLNIKTLIHYNDPLFMPSFFNNTYDFERYRFLSRKDDYSGGETSINNMINKYAYNQYDESSELVLIPKDIYLAYMNNEFGYPSTGITIDGSYNYYDKVLGYISYTSIYEMTNSHAESKTFSTFDIGIEIFSKVLKNIDLIKFNYSRSLSEDIFNFSDSNENTALGFSLIGKLKFGLILDLKFERVNYDYDFNGDADNIDIIDIGLIYRIY